MINLILFHSVPVGYNFNFDGSNLPSFIKFCFYQIRLFNPDIKIYFLTDKNLLNNDLFKKYDIVPIDKDNYYSNKIKEYETCYNYGANSFWTLAATRLIYIENFIKEKNMKDTYHFENDILLYYKLEDFHEKFKILYENIAITTGAPDKTMTGLMYIKNYESISNMTQFFIDTLKTYGVAGTQAKYGMDMVHEMSLMRFYGVEKGPNFLENLPILPFGEMSKNFNEFNSIFDAATWGQFVGGTRTDGPGAKPQDSYIGRLLVQNLGWSVKWQIEDGFKIPYFSYDDNLVKINNLHIHSKNLNLYISK
jgi:hypothetical protein